MLEAIKLLAVLGAICGALWFTYDLGDSNGYQRKDNESLSSTNKVLADELAKKEQEIADLLESDRQEKVDMIALQEAVTRIDRKAGSFQSQMRSAIDASGLAGCLYPADVRVVRGESVQEVRAAAESANASRDRARN